jgi:hypothetical protein
MPHSINHGDACLAYFNKIWGIPALNTLKRFGDNLPDIPVSAYAADGARRKIIIRPTSIQDVYYYSAPR